MKLDVPIRASVATIAAGSLASSTGLDVNLIQDWATRFATLFREYAIVGARLELRPQNVSPASGIIVAYLDEQTSSVPTTAEALARPRLDMIAGPLTVPRAYHLDWTPADILDLDFVSVASTFTPVWVKMFTNVANFGAGAGMTGQVLITGSLALEFRGFI